MFRFQSGTRHAPGGLAWVGERGAELVSLPKGSKVYTNRESKKIAGQVSRVNNINVIVKGNTIARDIDIDDIAQKVSDKIMDEVKNEGNV